MGLTYSPISALLVAPVHSRDGYITRERTEASRATFSVDRLTGRGSVHRALYQN